MNNSVNERVKLLRTALKLNQADFCMKIGMSVPGLYRIENSDVKPRTSTLRQISNIFNVNEDWLISGTGEMFVNTIQTDEKQQNWKETAFDVLKSENEFLKKQLSFTQELMNSLVKQFSKLDFLSGIAEMAGITECNSCNTVRVAQNAA
jgi:transcriptional regulator with XRE-family HTH domain